MGRYLAIFDGFYYLIWLAVGNGALIMLRGMPRVIIKAKLFKLAFRLYDKSDSMHMQIRTYFDMHRKANTDSSRHLRRS